MISLIINADDFGMSYVFNESILELCESQKITSTSVMVSDIAITQKSQINRLINYSNNSLISIGLHLNFTSPDYLNQTSNQFSKLF